MFRRVLILAALVLGCGVSVSAQGFRIGDAQTVSSSLTSTGPITPLQASVNVCVNPANAVPCTNKASTFTSVTLATPCSAATQVVLAGTTTCVTQTDVRGNWGAWVAAGNYDVTFTLATGQSFGPYTISVGIPPNTTIAGPIVIGPSSLTVSGNLNCKNVEGVLCTDSTNTQNWSGTDIGGWFNSAYAAAPTSGAEIWQGCKQDGTRLNFSTPIVWNTSGKYVAPRSLGPTNQNGFGCGLNYTPTTATSAMTIDFTPSGGGGYEPGDLFGIHLINNGCVGTGGTNGGCGSSATGIAFGATNGGGHMLKVHGRVAGFGTGINFGDAGGIGWGVGFDQFGCAWNTTCMNFPIYHENIHWIGGACAVNTTCISNSSGSDIEMFAVSVDSNLTASGWINPTGQITCWACHFENLGSGNAAGTQPFLVSNQTGGVYSFSGVAIDDNSNSAVLPALFSGTGGVLYWQGEVTSPNQTITNVLNNGLGMSGHISFFSPNPANVAPTATCATPFSCIVERFGYSGGPNLDVPIFRQPQDVLNTVTGQPNYVVSHMDVANNDTRVNYNNSGIMGFAPLVVSRATTSQKAESAADANVLTYSPAPVAGSYRIRFMMSVSAANAATLGWTATWTDSNGNAQAPANLALSQTGVAAPALTFTTSATGNYFGYVDIDINNSGANIVIKLTFSGTSFAAKVSTTIERII